MKAALAVAILAMLLCGCAAKKALRSNVYIAGECIDSLTIVGPCTTAKGQPANKCLSAAEIKFHCVSVKPQTFQKLQVPLENPK